MSLALSHCCGMWMILRCCMIEGCPSEGERLLLLLDLPSVSSSVPLLLVSFHSSLSSPFFSFFSLSFVLLSFHLFFLVWFSYGLAIFFHPLGLPPAPAGASDHHPCGACLGQITDKGTGWKTIFTNKNSKSLAISWVLSQNGYGFLNYIA